MKINTDININLLSTLIMSPQRRAGKSYTQEEQDNITNQISNKVSKNNEISIALSAFPFKIPNPLKTIWSKPQQWEMITLQRLNSISKNAEDIWFDLSWNIITDGLFYADELGVSKEHVDIYIDWVKHIANELGMKAEFIELDDIVDKTKISEKRLSLDNEKDIVYILRTAGMVNSHHHDIELWNLFENTKSVNESIKQLVLSNPSFRKQVELSAWIYQSRKELVEDANIFDTVFTKSIRATIQPDSNRNLQWFAINRPLSIRITDSKSKNLFPRLWVPHVWKECFNIFLAEKTTIEPSIHHTIASSQSIGM